MTRQAPKLERDWEDDHMVMLTGNSSVLPAGGGSSSPITWMTPKSQIQPLPVRPQAHRDTAMPPELEPRRFTALVRELYGFYVPSSSLFLFSFAS